MTIEGPDLENTEHADPFEKIKANTIKFFSRRVPSMHSKQIWRNTIHRNIKESEGYDKNDPRFGDLEKEVMKIVQEHNEITS